MHMRLLILLMLACAVNAVELIPRFITATTGDLLEWELRDVPAAWIVLDVEKTPSLAITDPAGRRWLRSAFVWQEAARNPDPKADPELVTVKDRGLRIRHTPRLPGVHRWVLSDAAGAELARGEVTVVAGTDPLGPVTISSSNGRLLAFADGTPFIPIGPNIAWAHGPDRLATMEQYFAALEAVGGTHARVWLASWCGQFESSKPDTYRLEQAWLVDGILASARAHHLHLTIVIDNHYDLAHGKEFPYGDDYVGRALRFFAADPSAQYQRKLRYLLARWGADDTVACWELFNEVDMACVQREITLPWILGAAKLLRRLDQDHRLSSISWAAQDWDRVFDHAELDLVQLRGYVLEWTQADDQVRMEGRDGVGLLINDAGRAVQRSRPFIFGEVGYQGPEQDNFGNDLDLGGMLLRQQAWAGLLLGGCGSGMNWWWDVYIDRRTLWEQYRGLSVAVKRMNWRDAGLTPLTPNPIGNLRVIGWVAPTQALLWPHIRSDTWHASLVEQIPRPIFPRPAKATLGGFVLSSRFRATWLDQISGVEKNGEDLQSDANGQLTLTVPADCRDLVVHLALMP